MKSELCFMNIRPTPIALLIAISLSGAFAFNANARDYFNPAMLEVGTPEQKGTDLSAFEQGDQVPGKYRVDIIINDNMIDTREVEFRQRNADAGDTELQPCLSVAELKSFGIKTELFPDLAKGECADLSAIPQASTDFQFNGQKLLLSIPQAATSPMARGYVSPEHWDEGITALMLNYSVSGANYYSKDGNGQDSSNQYANLRPGFNFGAWRLRNYSTWNRDGNTGEDRWDSVYTYAERNIVSLKSQLTLGDSTAPSEVFDSMPFRGAQLASDDNMLPDSLRGYAPVVRGIARTNAQVIIRQNGYEIYQSYVAPGAFEITDMYPTGGSGDLYVTIKEADGSEQNLVIPFASLPVLQREGQLKYSITGGQYRSYDSSVEKTNFAQGTLVYGLPHGFTIYGGGQQSSYYQSGALGIGKNMGDIGAISTDVTQAWSTPKDTAKSSGQSWRIRYSKNFVASGTNFAIAGYRYSTNGYYGMQEVLDSYGDSSALQDRRRNRKEVTVSQNLWEGAGSVSISALSEDYWNSGKAMESYAVGYNNSWKGISFGLNYSYNKNSRARGSSDNSTIYDSDKIFSFNMSVPLDRWLSNTWVNYSMSSSQKGDTTNTLGMSGSALADNNLSWNIQQGHTNNGKGNSGNINADYKGTYGEVTGGYGYDKNSQRLDYGLSGGIIAHSDGVTLSQPLGETMALVQAPGASGIGVNGQTGVKTDWRGYTVASNLTPYRKNEVTLNTETMGDNVDLDLTTSVVVPTKGAIVRSSYKANVGFRALMTLNRANGHPLPFGAMAIVNGKDDKSFIVGDAGQVYLTGLEPSGALTVTWGKNATETCQANYQLPEGNNGTGITMLNVGCR